MVSQTFSAAHIRMWITVKSRTSQRTACPLQTTIGLHICLIWLAFLLQTWLPLDFIEKSDDKFMLTHCLAFRQLSNSILIIPVFDKYVKLCWVQSPVYIQGHERADKAAKLHWMKYPLTWPYLSPIINHTFMHMFERNGMIYGTTR